MKVEDLEEGIEYGWCWDHEDQFRFIIISKEDGVKCRYIRNHLNGYVGREYYLSNNIISRIVSLKGREILKQIRRLLE